MFPSCIIVIRRRRWQAISPIPIDVTVPGSVCVCHVRALCPNGRILTRFLLHTTAPRHSEMALQFGLHRSTLSYPNFAPKWPTSCWLERRRHSTDNCGRMVRDSAMVTMESLQETTIALSNGTIADPSTASNSPKMRVLVHTIDVAFRQITFVLLVCNSATCFNLEITLQDFNKRYYYIRIGLQQ